MKREKKCAEDNLKSRESGGAEETTLTEVSETVDNLTTILLVMTLTMTLKLILKI